MHLVRQGATGLVNGVAGRFRDVVAWPVPVLDGAKITLKEQVWISEERAYGQGAFMRITIRHDDEERNGTESFSVIASVVTDSGHAWDDWLPAGRTMHDEMAEVFPELAPLARWHLCDITGPLDYIALTLQLADDRDHHGRRAGDPEAWDYGVRFGNSPMTHRTKRDLWQWLQQQAGARFRPISIPYPKSPGRDFDFSPKWTLAGCPAAAWQECPFGDQREAEEFAEALNSVSAEFVKIPVAWSKGKPRDLDGARRAALWPEATDAELSVEPEQLRAKLKARLPALMAQMRREVEAAGFIWSAGQFR